MTDAEPDVQELRRLCELIPKAANKDFSRSEWQRIARTFAIALKSRLSHPGTAPTREQIARIVEPMAFDRPGHTGGLYVSGAYITQLMEDALAKADAILALYPLHPQGREAHMKERK